MDLINDSSVENTIISISVHRLYFHHLSESNLWSAFQSKQPWLWYHCLQRVICKQLWPLRNNVLNEKENLFDPKV